MILLLEPSGVCGLYLALLWPSSVVFSHSSLDDTCFLGYRKIFEVLDTSPERYENSHSVTLPEIKGSIEFRDLHFSYNAAKK